jgi:thymidine phosphorylase
MERQDQIQALRLKRLNIDTGKSTIIYVSDECQVCKMKGFQTGLRVRVSINHRFIIATLNVITSGLLKDNEASLSEYAWELLGAKENMPIAISYPKPLKSLGYIRGKVYGKRFNPYKTRAIVKDIVSGHLSAIHIAAFLVVCTGGRLDEEEMTLLTQMMVKTGKTIKWPSKMIVDKHCIGGVPGNRTTMIVVPIVAAFGLTIPKTSSRSITSPAGTADTMETLASVDLNFSEIRRVVQQENGCLVWGGKSALSPADDILITVERELDLDSREQVVASILSKKIAAGVTHLVIDIPIGPTAKVRSKTEARNLKGVLERIGKNLGLTVRVVFTDGTQPVGYGIGPALEAKDVVKILKNEPGAHAGLRERSLILAGRVLEFSPKVRAGTGKKIAEQILSSGQAWKKFQAICHAQGGMKKLPPTARYNYSYLAERKGKIIRIDNRHIARLAKASGAPHDKAAGVYLHTMLGETVEKGQSILTIHAESKGELEYAMDYLKANQVIVLGTV